MTMPAAVETDRRIGQATIQFNTRPVLSDRYTVVGPKEGDGPLGSYFDHRTQDERLGGSSWEDAEVSLMKEACQSVLDHAGLTGDEIDLMFAGDLLNQITCCNFVARDLGIPFFGLFNACATYTEALTLAAMAIDGGFAQRALVATCSHNKTAERQYRFPTELGHQRPPTAQWTVTGSGANIVTSQELSAESRATDPVITHATIGRVLDAGVKNPNDMGSAMAPAAADTIARHFRDLDREPEDYDAVVTGDLARVGHQLARELLGRQGWDLGDRFKDCAILIYDQNQDVHAGASGTACSNVVFNAYLTSRLEKREWDRILLVATGSLHSPITAKQGKTIPVVAHAVSIERKG